MSLALRLVAHRLPHTASCVCAHSDGSSWIQHSILFSQIWELQNSIFLGSRSWQKCKCNIPDIENLHADSMYPWGSYHCAALFCPATAAVCLDKTFCRSWWHGPCTRLWHTGRSTLSCAHKTACVRARTQWRCPVPSKSHRYDVPEVEFKKMTPILRDFCLSGLKRVSCSANSKSSSTLAQGVALVRKPRLTALRCWTSNGVSLQKRRPKTSTDYRPSTRKPLFSFR